MRVVPLVYRLSAHRLLISLPVHTEPSQSGEGLLIRPRHADVDVPDHPSISDAATLAGQPVRMYRSILWAFPVDAGRSFL
jgi:hypothetical protein